MQKLTPLEPGKYYHIYNRGINRENIFFEERNYHYFLRLYARHCAPVAETFAYCLMRNHFHLLARIREVADLRGFENPEGLNPEGRTTQAFSNCFNAYAKAINKAYGRTGSLFQHRFGRVEVDSDRYFAALVRYIHFNPQKHGFVEDFRTYPYSSYAAFLTDHPTRLNRAAVLDWFGGAAQFVEAHGQPPDETNRYAPEDD